jgi:hypothetical protein
MIRAIRKKESSNISGSQKKCRTNFPHLVVELLKDQYEYNSIPKIKINTGILPAYFGNSKAPEIKISMTIRVETAIMIFFLIKKGEGCNVCYYNPHQI